MDEERPSSIITAFVSTPFFPSASRSPFPRPHVVRSRRSPPRTPPQKAPYMTALDGRTIRIHEDPNNIEHLAQTIASAFETDPVMTHFHGPREHNVFEKQLHFSRALLRSELLRPKGQSTVHVADDGACVAVWHHVGHWRVTGIYAIMLFLGLFRCFGLRAFMFVNSMQAVEEAHPSEPHMHLHIIGTHKQKQGKGYGSAVISEMLRRCDEQQLPSYLESSNERNLSFYQRHGFKVRQQISGLPPDFPPVYALWRDPRPIQEHPEQ